MGRRAKNKQPPPTPLDFQRPTKSTFKRKADALDDSAPVVKSVKKVKQIEIKSRRKDAGKSISKKKREQSNAAKGKSKVAPVDGDDEEWEDMDDEEEGLQTLTKHQFESSDEEGAAYIGGLSDLDEATL